MSMLAEPRRKQKWSVDPRNSTWSKDESKFGQKMLERMGWSKGKGLGRSEQGSTEHIKVKLKNDNYGLGTNASHEDNWISHQDEFNELLAQLNNCHGQTNSADPPSDEQKGFSLEEKSKTSKKRVHYMKFTKGKDLSSRSETDLNCIFGKRAQSAKEKEQEGNSSDSQGESEENSTPAASELDTESITNTVKSTMTMQEYFAQRMAQLKMARGPTQSAASSVQDETQTPDPSVEPSPNHSSNSDTEEPKKKKKKKKKKRATDELEVVEDSCDAPIVAENADNQEQERPKKKKKKRKMEDQAAANETCSSTSGVEQNCGEAPPPKKKKNKKRKETEVQSGHTQSDDHAVESEVVREKKLKEEAIGVEEEQEEEVVAVKKSKKNKKKKKHQD